MSSTHDRAHPGYSAAGYSEPDLNVMPGVNRLAFLLRGLMPLCGPRGFRARQVDRAHRPAGPRSGGRHTRSLPSASQPPNRDRSLYALFTGRCLHHDQRK